VTKYVSSEESATFEGTLKAAIKKMCSYNNPVTPDIAE
jgi:hypothetical protein